MFPPGDPLGKTRERVFCSATEMHFEHKLCDFQFELLLLLSLISHFSKRQGVALPFSSILRFQTTRFLVNRRLYPWSKPVPQGFVK